MYYDAALMAPTSAAGAATIRKLRNIGNPKPDDDGARLAHFLLCGRYPGGGYPMQSRRTHRARSAQRESHTRAPLDALR